MALAQTDYIKDDGLNFCGTEAQEIFAKDIYDIDLRQYGITFIDYLKSKRKIYLGNPDAAWQKYSCPFTPDGQVSLAEAEIEPVAIKVNKEFCRNEFWDNYLVEQTSITLNGGIPQSFANWYFDMLRKQMSKQYQEIFWKGDTDASGSVLSVTDGVEKRLVEGGAEVITGAAFTVDNAIAQVEAVILKGLEVAATEGVDTEGYKVFMNHADVRVLEVALGKVCCGNSRDQIFGNYARENGRIYVMGYEVVPSMVSKSTVIFGPARNLVLGFDSFDSHLTFKLIYMMDTTLDDMYRVCSISNIAVGVVLPELFVISKV
jgi:hypothetical protein